MLIRDRQNIIDLIWKGAYTSCVMTSYSFDFIFFEERLMPGLKSAGVKNINLFLDGHYFDDQLEKTLGREFQGQRTYSINTIYQAGIFHPKILFLVGAKQALLIIGSGNISTSGMSSNDEVWGAFHMNSIESPNAPLLAQAWKYLESLFSSSMGFNKEKIQWLYQRAPWLNDLSEFNNDDFVSIDKELDILFLSNEANGGIYRKVNDIIGSNKIDSLRIVSPYFDKDAKAIKQFLDDYSLEKIECLTDSLFGLLPEVLAEDYHNRIKFYEWKDCISGYDERLNRLHAKLFNFRLADGTEYLLIGSCNATESALGSLNTNPKNDEAAILIRRSSKDSFLSELGISTENAVPIAFKENQNTTQKPLEISTSLKLPYKIVHAEKNEAELSVTLQTDIEEDVTLVVRDKNLKVLEKHKLKSGKEFKIKLSFSSKAVQIYLEKGEDRVSNIRPIQDVFMLAKTNPDPKQAELNQLIESISEDADFSSIASLFQYLEYNRSDEDLKNSIADRKNPKIVAEKTEKEYGELTDEEFNQLPAVKSYANSIISHPNIQLAEFIGLFGKGLIFPKKEDVTEDIESSLDDNPDNQADGSTQIDSKTQHNFEGKLIKKAVLRHNDKLYNYHYDFVKDIFEKNELTGKKAAHITLNELSNLIILIGLLGEFYQESYEIKTVEFGINYQAKHAKELRKIEKKYQLSKSYKTDPDDINISFYYVAEEWFESLKKAIDELDSSLFRAQNEYNQKVFKHKYFIDSNIRNEDEDSVKYILLNTLGIFLLHVAYSEGFKNYRIKVLDNKLSRLRKTLFELSSSLILKLDWSENEFEYRDLLLLDLLHYISPYKDSTDSIWNKIEESTKRKSQVFQNNLTEFETRLLAPYLDWKVRYDQDRQSLVKDKQDITIHSIVYKSGLGFAKLEMVKADSILVKKPGLWLETEDNENYKINYHNPKILTF